MKLPQYSPTKYVLIGWIMAATIPCQIDGWFGHRDILSLAMGGDFLVHLVKLEVYCVLSRLLMSQNPCMTMVLIEEQLAESEMSSSRSDNDTLSVHPSHFLPSSAQPTVSAGLSLALFSLSHRPPSPPL